MTEFEEFVLTATPRPQEQIKLLSLVKLSVPCDWKCAELVGHLDPNWSEDNNVYVTLHISVFFTDPAHDLQAMDRWVLTLNFTCLPTAFHRKSFPLRSNTRRFGVPTAGGWVRRRVDLCKADLQAATDGHWLRSQCSNQVYRNVHTCYGTDVLMIAKVL